MASRDRRATRSTPRSTRTPIPITASAISCCHGRRDLRIARPRPRELEAVTPELLQALKSAPGLPDDLRAFVDVRVRSVRLRGDHGARCPRARSTAGSSCASATGGSSSSSSGRPTRGGDTIVWIRRRGRPCSPATCCSSTAPRSCGPTSATGSPPATGSSSSGPTVLVPGHGPVTDTSGVAPCSVTCACARRGPQRFDAGIDAAAAADDIDISDFADWGDPERIAANVGAAYREFDREMPVLSPAGAAGADGGLAGAPLECANSSPDSATPYPRRRHDSGSVQPGATQPAAAAPGARGRPAGVRTDHRVLAARVRSDDRTNTRWTSAMWLACAARTSARPASVRHASVARVSPGYGRRSTNPRRCERVDDPRDAADAQVDVRRRASTAGADAARTRPAVRAARARSATVRNRGRARLPGRG